MTSISSNLPLRDRSFNRDLASYDAGDPLYYGLTLTAWLKIGVLSVLMAAVFRFNLTRLWSKTNPFYGNPNWQHAIFIPLIGLYYLYVRRHELMRPRPIQSLQPFSVMLGAWAMVQALVWGTAFFVWVVSHPVFAYAKFAFALISLASLAAVIVGRDSRELQARATRWVAQSANWFGAFTMVWGILFFSWGIWPGQNDFFKDIGMVIALFGVVLLLAGWPIMRIAWFPIVFLFCAIPWPDQTYSWIAGPLQELAAKVAVHVLNLFGVLAGQEGTKIIMSGHGNTPRALNVAEACAGLRSLMTFISVAATLAFLSARPLWQKLVITFSAIPIAIACNVMRVSGQGLLDHYVSQELSESFAHQFVGMIMLIPAFFLILGVAWSVDHVFIEEVNEKDRPRSKAAGAGAIKTVINQGVELGGVLNAAAGGVVTATKSTSAPLQSASPKSGPPKSAPSGPSPSAGLPSAPPQPATPPSAIPPRPRMVVPPRPAGGATRREPASPRAGATPTAKKPVGPQAQGQGKGATKTGGQPGKSDASNPASPVDGQRSEENQ